MRGSSPRYDDDAEAVVALFVIPVFRRPPLRQAIS
jgi:hypothetical protein